MCYIAVYTHCIYEYDPAVCGERDAMDVGKGRSIAKLTQLLAKAL